MMKKLFCLVLVIALMTTAVSALAQTELPLTDKPETLTYWITLDNWKAAPELDSYKQIKGYQALEELTGVTIDFIHPVIGQETEQFNLMVASQDLPDMIFWGWSNYPGGPQKAIDDRVILPLNDLFKTSSPNVMEKVVGNPDIARTMATDDGTYFFFPYIHWNQLVVAGWTYQFRADRLAQLGLALPETIDEWYTVLTALKGLDPDKYPLIPYANEREKYRNILLQFPNAWGTDYDFYHTDGKVQYGPLDPVFKDYVVTMAKWYADGLIDPEFTSMDITAVEAKILNGDASAWLSGMDFGRYLIQMGDEQAITCAKFPVLNKGDLPIYNNGTLPGSQGSGIAITTGCKNPELAARWADFHYDEVGHNLLNFGIEGESYNMVNGTPTFTDEIVKNPDGKSVELALVHYAMGGIAEAFFHDPLVRFARFGTFEVQRESIERTQTIDLSHKMPAITPTSDESLRLASVMNEVNTYFAESLVKFIKGQANLDADYDTFIKTLNDLGIHDAIAIKQAALDRYFAR